MKRYSIENPDSFKDFDETISRTQKPYQLDLSEISQDELIYKEIIENQYLDKRTLGPKVYPYKTYVFNQNSIFINYLFMNERTRLLFLFRRLNQCQHKHSCAESILRKAFEVFSFYSLIRVPLKYAIGLMSNDRENVMDSKFMIGAEVAALVLLGGLRSAGCMVRFMEEEIIQQS